MKTTIPYRLVVESGDLAGMIYPLREDEITIGRGPENSIQVIDTRISRVHSRIQRRDGRWTIEDQRSKNGTLVNSTPIAVRLRLEQGDRIRIGDTEFIFEADLTQTAGGETETARLGVKLVPEDSQMETRHVLEVRGADDALDATAVRDVPKSAEARLQSIYQVGKLVQSILNLDELLDKLMEIVCRVLRPTHACILIYDRAKGILAPAAIHRPDGSTEDIIISGSIIERGMEERVAVVMRDARRDERFNAAESVIMHQIRSAICAPLLSKGEVFGALYVDSREAGREFSDRDLEWAAGVASQAALAIRAALLHGELIAKHQQERELEIARTIQMNLLPKSMPCVKGFEFGGMSEPARKVGGDYFDLLPLKDGDLALTIADVSGKGVPAALLLASLRAAVRIESRALPMDGVLSVMNRLNEAVCAESMSNMFVSMVLGYLEPETSRLTFCNAGHVHPILRTPDGELTQLETGGCFLGIMPGISLEKESIKLSPGSILVFVTDGVTDALNADDEVFGLERLHQFIRDRADLGAQEFCTQLHEAVTAFSEGAEPFDDFTVMVVRALEVE
jgi:serine phosphatase RsbU (regulator of sigma subunit)